MRGSKDKTEKHTKSKREEYHKQEVQFTTLSRRPPAIKSVDIRPGW